MRKDSNDSQDEAQDESPDDEREQADGVETGEPDAGQRAEPDREPGHDRHPHRQTDAEGTSTPIEPESAELRERREGFGGYDAAGGFGAEDGDGRLADTPDRAIGADADRESHDRNSGMRGYGDSGYGQSNDERGSEHLRSGEQRTGGFGYGAAGRAKVGDVDRAGAEQSQTGTEAKHEASAGDIRNASDHVAPAAGATEIHEHESGARAVSPSAQGDGDSTSEITPTGSVTVAGAWQQGGMAADGGEHGGSGTVTPAGGQGMSGAGSESTQPTEPGATEDDDDAQQAARTSKTVGA